MFPTYKVGKVSKAISCFKEGGISFIHTGATGNEVAQEAEKTAKACSFEALLCNFEKPVKSGYWGQMKTKLTWPQVSLSSLLNKSYTSIN